jgi:hypothetical protein
MPFAAVFGRLALQLHGQPRPPRGYPKYLMEGSKSSRLCPWNYHIIMANLAQNPILPNPFPRYQKLSTLTWEQCFVFSRDGILTDFVDRLSNVSENYAASVRKLAYLLSVMMKQPK